MVSGLVIVGAIGLKVLIVWAAQQYLYPTPILGGWLRSLEITELSNIVVFALLGFGLGSAAVNLRPCPLWQRAILLVAAMPLVFLSSHWTRYGMWIGEITETSDISPREAIALSDRALEAESGSSGFWGYFRFTTQIPDLPTIAEELTRLDADQQWFRSELTRYSGIEPGVFSILFVGVGWGIRIFHMVLAGLTGVIYFSKGLIWADTACLRKVASKQP